MGSDEPQFLGLCEIGHRIQKRQLSSVEVTKALIDRIVRLDGALRSYATRTFELALAQARKLTASLRVARYVGRCMACRSR